MKKIEDKIGSKYTPKRTKLHHLKKFLGEHAPEPPYMRKFLNLEKKISWPPLPNPGYAAVKELITKLKKDNNFGNISNKFKYIANDACYFFDNEKHFMEHNSKLCI